MKNKISVVIITLNEAAIIEKCLKNLKFADEIIVVDSGSTDETVAICERFNAKVFYNKFEGFGIQKQFAVSKASNKWILSLDADEILSEELINAIKFEINQEIVPYSGFYMQCQHVFMNKTFKHGYESKRYFLRLFNKDFGNFNSNAVHENIEIQGNTKKIKAHFLHFSYLNVHTYISKLNRYTDFYAKTKFKQGKKYGIMSLFFKVNYDFFKKYIFDRNFLNGKEGFYWSVFSAFYTFTKCVKTNEQYKLNA